jgi:hypothetical protein
MRSYRRLATVLVLVAPTLGCRGPTRPVKPVKPVTAPLAAPAEPVPPPPACDVPPEAPADLPRGKVLALYHTANVVGEVEPCG